jgi:hypothetical protein
VIFWRRSSTEKAGAFLKAVSAFAETAFFLLGDSAQSAGEQTGKIKAV